MSALALYLAAGLATFWTCALIDRLKSRKLDRRARPSLMFWRTRWVEPNRAWLRRLAVETLTRMFFCMTIWPLFFVALMFQSVHERFSFGRHADHVFRCARIIWVSASRLQKSSLAKWSLILSTPCRRYLLAFCMPHG